jgi:hypothetical protein
MVAILEEDKEMSKKSLEISIQYEWRPILSSESQEYRFPDRITDFMKQKYNIPAIYRWILYRNDRADPCKMYIGSAMQLCPQRIRGYLNPGPTQETNKRLNSLFNDHKNRGFKISLDYLEFEELRVGSLGFKDLGEKDVRLFLERAMISLHKWKSYRLLNKDVEDLTT